MAWTRLERAWRDDVLRALMPPHGGVTLLPPDLDGFWNRFLAAAPPSLRATVRLAVWMIALWLPLLWTARTLARLAPDARDRVVTRAASSNTWLLRQLVGVVKLCACFAAFGHAPTRARFLELP
jgi:hypothetical protein